MKTHVDGVIVNYLNWFSSYFLQRYTWKQDARIASSVRRLQALPFLVVLLAFCLSFPCIPLKKKGRKLVQVINYDPVYVCFICLLAFLSHRHLFKSEKGKKKKKKPEENSALP